MDLHAFQSELRRVFDSKIEVKRDRRDHCMVVWDRTLSGTPYPVMKIACDTTVPSRVGVYREAYSNDIDELRKRDWFSKHGGSRGRITDMVNRIYVDSEEHRAQKHNEARRETTMGPVRDYALWRCGVRNTISLRPNGDSGSGGMKNRHHDGRRRVTAKLKRRGIL